MSFPQVGNGVFRIARRFFSDIGKTKIGDLPEPMRKHVQNACRAVEDLDPRMGFAEVKGQEHDSTTVPGTKCVTVECFKFKAGTEDLEVPLPGSRWGTMHVHADGAVAYGAKAVKSINSAQSSSVKK